MFFLFIKTYLPSCSMFNIYPSRHLDYTTQLHTDVAQPSVISSRTRRILTTRMLCRSRSFSCFLACSQMLQFALLCLSYYVLANQYLFCCFIELSAVSFAKAVPDAVGIFDIILSMTTSMSRLDSVDLIQQVRRSRGWIRAYFKRSSLRPLDQSNPYRYIAKCFRCLCRRRVIMGLVEVTKFRAYNEPFMRPRRHTHTACP